jgi:hypothetical protein
MLLYCQNKTPRLTYAVEFIGKELFDDSIKITSDKADFAAFSGPKINYSEEESGPREYFLKPVSLLFENEIRKQEIECFELNFYKAFYETSGDFPFDIFAACFYLLSRYEEYLPHEKDEFGRFSHAASLAFKENFLQTPLINIWLHDFKKSLIEKFPDLVFHHSYFKFLPTYDIDIAYSYLHKGWKRNVGGFLRSLFKGHWAELQERIFVLSGKRKDPYDAYEWLDSLHLYCRTRAYYFFLLAKDSKGYDKNISPSSEALKNLIRYHSRGYTVGIHPSWQSGDDNELLHDELASLEQMIEKKVAYSRQHYIRLSMPETYRRLIEVGVEKDFSMGYGTINGFRASFAGSFPWYDLANDSKTSLQLFPFCFMDANSFYEQKLNAGQALHELMTYYHAIKKVNGLMVTIWHNQFLGSDPLYTGWNKLYEIFLKEEVYWDT